MSYPCCPCKPLRQRSSQFCSPESPCIDKGKFVVAWLIQTPTRKQSVPCGWQLEFEDSPRNVEARCEQMVEWINCPPVEMGDLSKFRDDQLSCCSSCSSVKPVDRKISCPTCEFNSCRSDCQRSCCMRDVSVKNGFSSNICQCNKVSNQHGGVTNQYNGVRNQYNGVST